MKLSHCKKLLLLALCLALSGCVQFPLYHSHTQEIDLTEFHTQNPDAKVYYDDEEQTDKVELFRSWFDKELVIKKEGFKDYHIKLESVWTDDDWARIYPFEEEKNEYPFISLSIPGNTLFATFIYPPALWIFLPVAVPLDAVNLISVPILPIWNPWKEYQNDNIERKKDDIQQNINEWKLKYSVILEPTDELKKSCNKKGYFISNLGCTTCSYKEIVVASEKECLKCSNRHMDSDGYCRLCNGTVSKDGKNCIEK